MHQLQEEFHESCQNSDDIGSYQEEESEVYTETPVRYEDIFRNVPSISKFEPPPAYYSKSSSSEDWKWKIKSIQIKIYKISVSFYRSKW